MQKDVEGYVPVENMPTSCLSCRFSYMSASRGEVICILNHSIITVEEGVRVSRYCPIIPFESLCDICYGNSKSNDEDVTLVDQGIVIRQVMPEPL